jgi:nitrous oxide reductase accessory protein NosL
MTGMTGDASDDGARPDDQQRGCDHEHGQQRHDHEHRARELAPSRRSLLSAVAGAAALGLAGCSGQPGGEETTETETATTDTETTTQEPTETTQADVTEPVAVPEDAECAVCGMQAAKFSEWNAQLSYEDGERVHFCTSGCLAAYHSAPSHFHEDRTWDQVAGAWVRDFDSKELIDASAANYVLEMDNDRVDDPMMKNPLPFAEMDGAVAYVDQYDDLTRQDVVGLDAFDVPLARKYRARFLPETEESSALDRVPVPDDAECAVCGMKAANFPEWNGEVSFEDGERAYFCSPGCMASYYADPGHFHDDRTQDDVLGGWAHDYDSKDFVDAFDAYWVLEMNADRIDAPMKKNPLPFADREAAVAYVDQYDDLTEDDVIRLTAFDRELATDYRAKFF